MSTTRLSSTAAALLLLVMSSAGVCGCKKVPVPRAGKVKPLASARAAAAPRPPPPPPPPPRSPDGTYTVAGVTYLELVTGGAKPSDTLPMVVGLHAHGSTPEFFERHFGKYTGKARFILPFGPYPAGRGYEWTPKTNEMTSKQAAAFLPSAVGRLVTSLKEIERVRPTAGRPIVTGFSNGANMSYGIALLKGDSFSAFCIMAGHLPPELFAHATAPKPPPDVHGFYGDIDPGYPHGKQTISNLQKLGFATDLKVFRGVGHNFEPASSDVLACIDRAVVKQAAVKK